jgi:nicotinate-nucleotide pyrophosphorylase (carboxylating)
MPPKRGNLGCILYRRGILNYKSRSEFDLSSRLQLCFDILPKALQNVSVLTLIENSLAEDLHPAGLGELKDDPSQYDITSAAILPQDRELSGRVFTRKPGVIAGLPLMASVFKVVDPVIEIEFLVSDGDRVNMDQNLAMVSGEGGSLLAGERIAMNFLGRLSGIATMARKFVDAVAHTNAIILDTRKTAPCYRLLDKYAVRMGGGKNHRMGLYDMILIKNNHIDSAGGIEAAVNRVREQYGDRYSIEVEVRNLEELKIALALTPTCIMLDNMDLETMHQAVELSGGKVPLEASGNVTINTVAEIAETGVDYISAGSLTHSAPVLDISMHVDAASKME